MKKSLPILIIAIVALSLLIVTITIPELSRADTQPSSWIASNNVFALHNLQTHEYCLTIQDIPGNITIMSVTPTQSMLPTISDNSKILVLELDDKTRINIGDIAVFRYDGHIISHRVIEKNTDSQGLYFVTKGDHNIFDDISFCGKVRSTQVMGIVVGVLY